MKWFVRIITFTLLLIPALSYAQGLVPCNGPDCQTCDILKLIQNVITFLISTGTAVAVIRISWTGINMVIAGDSDPFKHSELRKQLNNTVIGFGLMLGAWIIVDTTMKLFLNDQVYGGWNKIQCVAQPTAVNTRVSPGTSTATSSGGGPVVIDTSGVNALNTSSVQQKYASAITTSCSGSVLGSACADVVTALITKESGGNPGAVSPAGARGIMQLLPANGGQACSANDAACITSQITRGVAYLSSMYSRASGNMISALAAYNGGPNAILPSACCSIGLRYQCDWDCGNVSGTHVYACEKTPRVSACVPNTGYIETRDYVAVICKTSGRCN